MKEVAVVVVVGAAVVVVAPAASVVVVVVITQLALSRPEKIPSDLQVLSAVIVTEKAPMLGLTVQAELVNKP